MMRKATRLLILPVYVYGILACLESDPLIGGICFGLGLSIYYFTRENRCVSH